ncbi:MAG TPA: sugar nucleotide-binding protein [Candidatus Eisenbacteria bacterium]|nr:sugar nucleotide-binding protein [Candidatus Eisenbacteria bacterium]
MKKIFLTGSTSFLGSKFIELYKDQYNIFGVAKSDPVHPVDVLDLDAVKKAYLEFLPDVIIHTAALVDHNNPDLVGPNVLVTKNVVEVAKMHNIPIIFASSESVYGGKENTGEYVETDPYKPRNAYGESKVESEKVVIASGLPYLITRCHRYVGINKNYTKPKQFLDSIRPLIKGEEVHVDSHKLFRPCLINNIADVYVHYIEHDADKKIIINLGVDRATTYYNFIVDVAKELGLDTHLVKPDGEEKNWPENSTLSVEIMKSLGYPFLTYQNLLVTLKKDWGK